MKQQNLKYKLDRIFSEFVRLRDADANGYCRCISCGKIKRWKEMDCGHYINRKHMSTRYNEMNCNAQCRHCNRFDEGNMQGYRRTLVRMYGEQNVLHLEALKNETRKFSDGEYIILINHYKELVSSMKKEKGI